MRLSELRRFRSVLFKDGSMGRHIVQIYQGACLVGDPTAYVYRGSNMVWVVPGESVEFIEA